MTKVRIGLTGGGSGGHIYPLLAVVEAIRAKNQAVGEINFHYFGPRNNFDFVLGESLIAFHLVYAGKIRRYLSGLWNNLLDLPLAVFGFVQALVKLYWVMPDVLFSKGGGGSLPVVLAAWFYHIPIVIHDSDAVPGLNNLLVSRLAAKICVSFERALKYFDPRKTTLTGNPIRPSLLAGELTLQTAKTSFGFNSEKLVLLVLGASQGSSRLNNLIMLTLPDLLKEAQVLHQTGRSNFEEVQKLAKAALTDLPNRVELKSAYKCVPFFDNNYYAALLAADLIVARAASGTIFEIAAFGKPAIVVPLTESANDHQRANAYEFAKSGAAVVIEETNLLPGIFLSQVKSILNNKLPMDRMSSASSGFFKPQAAADVANVVLGLLPT